MDVAEQQLALSAAEASVPLQVLEPGEDLPMFVPSTTSHWRTFKQ